MTLTADLAHIDFTSLIERRNKWVAHNFPTQVDDPGSENLLGCIEEAGELAHGFLKRQQGIRGTYEEHTANMRDAVGDIAVYLLGVMVHKEWEGYHPTRNKSDLPKELELAIRSLNYQVANLAHPDRGNAWGWAINKVLEGLVNVCECAEWAFDEILYETWEAVETRDWIAYPDTGRPPNTGTDQELGKGPAIEVGDRPDLEPFVGDIPGVTDGQVTSTEPTSPPDTGRNLHGGVITGTGFNPDASADLRLP